MAELDLRSRQQVEAVARLKLLNVSRSVIRDFLGGIVHYSERQNKLFDGILYWISNEEQYVTIVNNFEKENGALVYHAQLTHTELGSLLSIFYVSKTESEWEADKEDIKNGQAVVYVVNLDDEYLSEFGTIGISPKNGGVSRTW
jgi:hypothetical protein